MALVIGNSNYQSVPPLSNPGNDAVAVSQALRTHGFEVFTAVDMSRTEMPRAIRDSADIF